jgi:hypothetical protein
LEENIVGKRQKILVFVVELMKICGNKNCVIVEVEKQAGKNNERENDYSPTTLLTTHLKQESSLLTHDHQQNNNQFIYWRMHYGRVRDSNICLQPRPSLETSPNEMAAIVQEAQHCKTNMVVICNYLSGEKVQSLSATSSI